MKTAMKSQLPQPDREQASVSPPEDEDTFGPTDEPSVDNPEPSPLGEPPIADAVSTSLLDELDELDVELDAGNHVNPWRSIDYAPKDRIIQGRMSEDDEIGIPIRWRNSRRRGSLNGRPHWLPGGVWHPADTAGACQVHPIEWREWVEPYYHIAPKEEPSGTEPQLAASV